MKVLLIGPTGQLGSDLQQVLSRAGYSVVPVTHAQLDLKDRAQVRETITAACADVVINAAAFHKLEDCEKDPHRAFVVNAIGAMELAEACRQAGSILVHFSTDYVFDGKKATPYFETDLAQPVNVYGVSKLAGENLIGYSTLRYFIVRTCGLFGFAGSSGKGGNFVENMLKRAATGAPIKVVDDQVLTPTSATDLAETVVRLISTDAYGLYHISSEGECSWYEFTRSIFEMHNLAVDLSPVKTADFPTPVMRPAYSVMSKQKLRSIGLSMPHWRDALARYLAERRRLTAGA